MDHWIKLIDALVPLAWPIIVVVMLWRLFPLIRSIVKSRSFTVKFAGAEVTVQNATEQLSIRVEDLQRQVVALKEAGGSTSDTAPAEISSTKSAASPVLLWVDDKPENNAFEVAQIRDWDVQVLTAVSTREALDALQSMEVTAVVSDMGRFENGLYHPHAGLALLNAMRAAGLQTPFFVYSSASQAARNNDAVRSAGGSGATASPVNLLEWLRTNLGISKVSTASE